MKNTGIWLDRKRALIVNTVNNEETLKIIHSDVDDYRITGNKHIGGPNEIVKDREYLEREKHQLKSYFKAIVNELNDTNALVIFGPAETAQHFAKELEEHYKSTSEKIKGIRSADSMTDNQVIAWVRDFFESN